MCCLIVYGILFHVGSKCEQNNIKTDPFFRNYKFFDIIYYINVNNLNYGGQNGNSIVYFNRIIAFVENYAFL